MPVYPDTFPHLLALPVSSLLAVFQKLNPASFIALRTTCSQMNNFAEEYRAHIGIKLYQINLIPQECYQIPEHYQSYYELTGIQLFPIELMRLGYCKDLNCPVVDYELKIDARQLDRTSTKKIKLSEAYYRLSGFTFDKVIGGLHGEEGKKFVSLPPNALEAILEMLNSQKWRCSGMSMDKWLPTVILDVIRPRILRLINRELTICPKETDTVLIDTYGYKEKDLIPIKSIPPTVKNILIDQGIGLLPDLHCLPAVFSEITTLFYIDQLPVAHVQVKSFGLTDDVLLPIIKDMRNKEAGLLFLQEMLASTPYSHEKVISFGAIERPTSCGEKWIATGNVQLTSRSGHKGLLAIRLENVYDDREGSVLGSFSKKAQEFGGWNWMPDNYISYMQENVAERHPEDDRIEETWRRLGAVSAYFWKGKVTPLQATDPYFQIPSDGIWQREMRNCK